MGLEVFFSLCCREFFFLTKALLYKYAIQRITKNSSDCFFLFFRDYSWCGNQYYVFKGSFSCKWVKKSIFFFHHYSIAYAFRNTHAKFQAEFRRIVEVMNFFVTSRKHAVFGTKNFKRVFLETMFFKLACTTTKEQPDIFQKFLYRIKLY